MERIKGAPLEKPEDMDKFYKKYGTSFRNKDYTFLKSVFDVSNFKGTLLDMGCGLGDGVLYLKNKCPHITKFYAADVSPQAINTCKNNPLLKDAIFFLHDIMNPLPNNYDVVICLQTLEHVLDPTEAMKNLINAANSLLIVAVPYKNRRTYITHIWSFDEYDFCELVDLYRFGQKKTNIYWLVDKKQEK